MYTQHYVHSHKSKLISKRCHLCACGHNVGGRSIYSRRKSLVMFKVSTSPAEVASCAIMSQADWCLFHVCSRWINMASTFNIHPSVESPGSVSLKRQRARISPFAPQQASAICAWPVTLSSSSNIQTSLQFKLAGHGPVTYFPPATCSVTSDRRLCAISLLNLNAALFFFFFSTKRFRNSDMGWI